MATAAAAAAAAMAPPGCPGSCPNFAVVCSFLERYGPLLDLPELPFPELERVLQAPPPDIGNGEVPKELVELHLKLMRKIGKSVTADRWEKYLIKICQEFNSTWAWEMEKKGYLEMSVECKLALLKYLCECQFDDNLKFKNIINEEDADTMRLQPIGRDKEGLMYWYQLDQDHNVRMYIEEQDDQDGSSWKCIVRNRNELAETLALLKAQIDPVLLKNSSQQEDSSRESPTVEDEETKKEEETPKQEGSKENEKTKGNAQPVDPIQRSVDNVLEEAAVKIEKEDEKELMKLPVIVKLEKTLPESEEKKIIREESDSFKENVKPIKGEKKECRVDSKDLKGSSERLGAQEPERVEFGGNIRSSQDITEKSSEETEKLKNDQQAKIPLKKREIKLSDDFDRPLCKSATPTKEFLKDEIKQEEETCKRVSTISSLSHEGKQLVNGEISDDKVAPNFKVEQMETQLCDTKDDGSAIPSKDGNNVMEGNGTECLNSVITGTKIHELEKEVSLEKGTDSSESALENHCQKGALEESEPPDVEMPLEPSDIATDLSLKHAVSATELCTSKVEEKTPKSKKENHAPGIECLEKVEKAKKTAVDKERLSPIPEEVVRSPLESEKPGHCEVAETSLPPEITDPSKKLASEKKGVECLHRGLSEGQSPENAIPEILKEDSESMKVDMASLDNAQASGLEDTSETKGSVQKNKFRYKLIPEGDSTSSENTEITSERQKEGIKLTIRISSRKKKPDCPPQIVDSESKEDKVGKEEEKISVGRTLRRSPRISRPTAKVAEIRDQKADKKKGEGEDGVEEEPTALQRTDKKEHLKKTEKDTNSKVSKVKPKGKVRWTGSRTRGRWKYSSNDESEGSDSEKSSAASEEEGGKESEEAVLPDDDEPCKKCGLPNHPELILLCDSCDSGYHTACLRPPLMIIPDGEWFCPPCQHKLLCEKLEEQLQDLDVALKKKERAERRKERLVYVGISIENIIPPQEPEFSEEQEEKKKDAKKSKANLLERRSTRTRKCISYRFDEFDEAIDEAIEDDIKEADGGAILGYRLYMDQHGVKAKKVEPHKKIKGRKGTSNAKEQIMHKDILTENKMDILTENKMTELSHENPDLWTERFFNRKCCITFLTGCYSCHWQYREWERTELGSCCCSWKEQIFYVCLVISFILSAIFLFVWAETSNEYNSFDWVVHLGTKQWFLWSIVILSTAGIMAVYTLLLLIVSCFLLWERIELYLHTCHKVLIFLVMLLCSFLLAVLNKYWKDKWLIAGLSLQIFAPFVHLSLLTVMIILSWPLAIGMAHLESEVLMRCLSSCMTMT